MMMRKWWIAAAALAVAACGAQTPQEREADQLRDAAEAQADAIEAQAGNVSAGMKAEAEQLRQQAGQGGGYDAQRLQVRAEAREREAKLVEEQAEAKARAVRDEGKAKASALLAK
ncbi:hypothetical protein VPH46_04155 [Sphingomonas sp. MJ1 (PH-R8)]|uniref:hypothetical protein n=1 Tax=Sphingomonas sp. MJ1 (PH-R8) TaxID=3112950 RepID=UPI003A8A53AD